MRGSHYTEEQNKFITEHYLEMNYSELAKLFNKTFGKNVSAKAMANKIQNLGLKKGYKRTSMFTEDADAFLIENAMNFTSGQLSEMLQERFGFSAAKSTISEHLSELGVHRGNCYRPKGYLDPACLPIGTERIQKKTVMVKVGQPNVWVTKARFIMGHDPKTHVAIFLDGNSLNCTPENIVVVSKKIHARLAKNGWLNSSNEVILTGIKWCELLYAIKELSE